jgi:hypothetical protein
LPAAHRERLLVDVEAGSLLDKLAAARPLTDKFAAAPPP